MNYKHLFPTFRNRYLFIRNSLEQWSDGKKFEHILNLGTGEGDYDRMIASHCRHLTAVDINQRDIDYARELNRDVTNLDYGLADALNLKFPDHSFDVVVSVEVIEHVGNPEQMINEIQRVLKPGGLLMITFPYLDFPFTYDPINRILSWFSNKHLSQGAYAFGHDYLISKADFLRWADNNRMTVVQERNLSGDLVGLLEMYWTGIIQRIFKANAMNVSKPEEGKLTLRPTRKEPLLTSLTDWIIAIDYRLFKNRNHSVGKGFILRKDNR